MTKSCLLPTVQQAKGDLDRVREGFSPAMVHAAPDLTHKTLTTRNDSELIDSILNITLITGP